MFQRLDDALDHAACLGRTVAGAHVGELGARASIQRANVPALTQGPLSVVTPVWLATCAGSDNPTRSLTAASK